MKMTFPDTQSGWNQYTNKNALIFITSYAPPTNNVWVDNVNCIYIGTALPTGKVTGAH